MYFLLGFFLFLLKIVSTGCIQSREERYCENDDQCQSFVQNSKCIDRCCKCTDIQLLSSDGTKCLPKIKGYESFCEDNVQCSHELSSGGICKDNVCKCKDKYHYLKGSCWKSFDLNEKCLRDEQCFSTYEYIGLKCDNGVCKCQTKYYERLNSGCRRKRIIGESCNLDMDCVDGSTCEKMVCSKVSQVQKMTEIFSNATFGKITEHTLNCSKGMFEFNNTCALELGMSCTSDFECNHIQNALCLDKSVCGCQPATYIASENNRECLRVARGKISDVKSTSCKSDFQCGVFGKFSFCQNKRCACQNESYWEKENTFCWHVKKLKESCISAKDCHPTETRADCLNNVCACRSGYHPKGYICELDAIKVGDPCENDRECLFKNSFCNSSKVCTCKEQYYPEAGKCISGVGTLCDTHNDCAHLKNTECKMGNQTEKQCLCLDHYFNSEDYKYCLPELNFKEKCSETFQCIPRLGDLAECSGNFCQCRNKTHYSYGKCYHSKFFGERCLRLPDCFPGNDTNSVICLKGFCSCNYDYELDTTGICVKASSGTSLKFYSMSLIAAVIFNALRRYF